MATYKIKGDRFVRMYKAPILTPAYSAPLDAATIVEEMCDVPWTFSEFRSGGFPAHSGNTETDSQNVSSRELYDAYEFCAEHANGMHRAYAGAACYRFTLPSAAVGLTLSQLKVSVSCDPYNASGARVAVYTKNSPTLPLSCSTCRNGSNGDTSVAAQSDNASGSSPATVWSSTNTHVEGVAPRSSSTSGTTTTWYPNSGTAEINPSGGLTLSSYLYVFVCLENYNYSRQGYLEGSASASPTMEITLTEAITNISDGSTLDCTSTGNGLAIGGTPKMLVTTLPEYNLKTYESGNLSTGQFSRLFTSGGFCFAFGSGNRGGSVLPGLSFFKSGVSCSFQYTAPSSSGSFSYEEYAVYIESNGFLALNNSLDITGFLVHNGGCLISTRDHTSALGKFIQDTGSRYHFYPFSHRSEGYSADLHLPGCDLLVAVEIGDYLTAHPITIADGKITDIYLGDLAYDGIVTGIGQYGNTESGRFVLAGDFTSVGGIPVKNACIVDIRTGGFHVIPIECDGLITPNHLDGFRIVYNKRTVSDATDWKYCVTGTFSKLGSTACNYASAIVDSSGVVTPDTCHYIDFGYDGSSVKLLVANTITT